MRLDAIANKRLYFATPDRFNDPFDCRPKFSLFRCRNAPENDWERYFFLLAKKTHPDAPDEEARKHARAAINKGLHRDRTWLCRSDEEIKTRTKDLAPRICCFAKSPRNSMMWAHYADNHKGMALQFRVTGKYEDSQSGFEVQYYPNHISLKRYVDAMEEVLTGDPGAFARLIYLSKSEEWKSEDEVRFFSENEYVDYDETMLAGILFGAECSTQCLDRTRALLSTWVSQPTLFQEDSSVSSVRLYFRRL